MSRALDQETAASLAASDPQKAYRDISALFAADASPGRLEIEILGHLPDGEGEGGGSGSGSGAVVLRDGPAVAIAKKGLVLAFFVARKVLQEALQRKKIQHGKEDEEQQERQAAALAAATAVLLLLDPEHLTAANTRKRLLQARLARARQAQQKAAQAPALLAAELVFVDSLLTSHLHRHTKSPTLWSHRRWLVTQRAAAAAPALGGGEDVRGDLADVVMVAAVRHPRNYYAWDHARWLVARQPDDDDNRTEEQQQQQQQLVTAVRSWCFQHHTDTSGWSFLLYLLERSRRRAGDDQLLRDTLATTAQRALALRWAGEAVWVFLRTATASLGGSGPEDDESTARFRDTAAALQGRLDPASRDYQVLQQAQDWVARALSSSPSSYS